MPNETTQSPALLSIKDLVAMLGIAPRTIWRLRDAGKMPQPVRLGGPTRGAIRWRRTDIMAWIENGCPSCRRAGGADGRGARR
jgi:predicted DNA-binding transcriptional regulator AlpA